jgi:uncharacterized protein (TIGR02145 family)
MKTTTLSSIILVVLSVLFVSTAFTQTGGMALNNDGSSPHASAIMDLQSTQHGLLIPRMTTAQRGEIKSPAEGLLIYNTTTNKLDVYTGAEGWYSLESVSDGVATGSTAPGGGMSVNESGADPHGAAILDVYSTEKGFLLPRTQTSSVSGPAESLIIFNTVSKRLTIYDGSDWTEPLHDAESTTTGAGTGSHTGVLISNTDETAPHHSAMLELRSTNGKGLLVPRMTTDQRNALSPEQGLIVYNTTTQTLNYCTGTVWNKLDDDSWACGDNITFTYNGSEVTYGTVESDGKCWLDRNLGATQVAASSTDHLAYGDLFQWGRAADGHQLRTSGVTPGACDAVNTDNPPHSNFIKCNSGNMDWRDLQNPDLWQGVDGTNNPCPSGFRLPTSVEWEAERASWISYNADGAFNSPLKLTLAGYRLHSNASIQNPNAHGFYWSSSVIGNSSAYIYFFDTNALFNSLYRGNGFSVRCIKEENTACDIPPAPTQGTHTPAETQIQWNWNTSEDADGYKYNTVNNYASATDNGANTTFIQESLDICTEYNLYVWAYNACGESSALSMNETTTGSSPTVPTAGTHTPSQTQIIWNWNSVTGADAYKYNTVNNYATATDNGANTTYTHENLNCGTEYNLYVWAYNNCGESSTLQLTHETDACSVPFNCGDSFTDTRDENVYPSVQIGNQCWMAKNLAYLPLVNTNAQFQSRGNSSLPAYGVYNYNGSDLPTATSDPNYLNYGVLYNWFAVMDGEEPSTTNPSGVQGICPAGWELPSAEGFTELSDYLITQSYTITNLGNTLKSCRQEGSPLGGECDTNEHPRWDSHATHYGTDNYNFNGIPGGQRAANGTFSEIGQYLRLWTATNHNAQYSIHRSLRNNTGSLTQVSTSMKKSGLSVRCVRATLCDDFPNTPTESTHIPSENQIIWNWNTVTGADGYKYNTINSYATATDNGTSTTYTQIGLGCDAEINLYVWAYNHCGPSLVLVLTEVQDDLNLSFTCGGTYYDCRDGKHYATMLLGTQCWMSENLKYNVGCGNWAYSYDNGWCGCYGDNNANCETYGTLYQWSGAMNGSTTAGAQGRCPIGWHVPTDGEWKTLEMHLGMSETQANGNGWRGTNEGAKLAGNYDLWINGNLRIHPDFGSTGFDVLPGGFRAANHLGQYFNLGEETSYWTSSSFDATNWATIRFFRYNNSEIGRGDTYEKQTTSYVRCIKD